MMPSRTCDVNKKRLVCVVGKVKSEGLLTIEDARQDFPEGKETPSERVDATDRRSDTLSREMVAHQGGREGTPIGPKDGWP
ncbi:hypothetical protein HYFRA_00003965 [Hymenoscyphus fraxineus]|uniref:Uncharacterized protein n=1 Tax=Hymenoscyphus fraxineus TaxID=746836 RepID=A0A9N9KYX5_9HELO|nr:hypothetical protein HYFRA_00003965 [Hymenoscyphus fraxineus]